MILKIGSNGPEVKILQAELLVAGFDPHGDDGVFGHDTNSAVLAFQTARRLTADGVVTWPSGETANALAGVPDTAAAPIEVPDDAVTIAIEVPDDAVIIGENFEGFSATPYWDPNGRVWTYGFGSTRDLNNNPVTATTQPVSRAQGLSLMRRDMLSAATEVAADVHVPLTENEKAALDDFIYNCGVGNFRGSTLLRMVNAGNFAGAADQFAVWDHSGGVVLAGLLRRRQAERAEFLKQ